MRRDSISEQTAQAILEAAWRLIVDSGRADASMTEVARAAQVTRQSVYLAFGSRAGLLIAMARSADAKSVHARRMAEIAATAAPSAQTLLDFTAAWLAHLPEVYPVGHVLVAAAVTDADAASVLKDRLDGSLHARFLSILARLAAQGKLAPGVTPEVAADLIWSWTHLDAWKHLVVQRGWTPRSFCDHRLLLIRQTILA